MERATAPFRAGGKAPLLVLKFAGERWLSEIVRGSTTECFMVEPKHFEYMLLTGESSEHGALQIALAWRQAGHSSWFGPKELTCDNPVRTRMI